MSGLTSAIYREKIYNSSYISNIIDVAADSLQQATVVRQHNFFQNWFDWGRNVSKAQEIAVWWTDAYWSSGGGCGCGFGGCCGAIFVMEKSVNVRVGVELPHCQFQLDWKFDNVVEACWSRIIPPGHCTTPLSLSWYSLDVTGGGPPSQGAGYGGPESGELPVLFWTTWTCVIKSKVPECGKLKKRIRRAYPGILECLWMLFFSFPILSCIDRILIEPRPQEQEKTSECAVRAGSRRAKWQWLMCARAIVKEDPSILWIWLASQFIWLGEFWLLQWFHANDHNDLYDIVRNNTYIYIYESVYCTSYVHTNCATTKAHKLDIKH